MLFGNGYTNPSYYDHVLNSNITGIAYAVNFATTANQDSIRDGTLFSPAVVVNMAGQHDTLDDVDIENSGTAATISGSWNVILPGWTENTGPYIFEAGTTNNVLFGNWANGTATDLSGNLTNFIYAFGQETYWPTVLEAMNQIGIGNAGGGLPTEIFTPGSQAAGTDFNYTPKSAQEIAFGLHGHANLNLGAIAGFGGISSMGLVSTTVFSNPSAPSCSVVGTAGSASIKYAVEADDYNGGRTLVSADATVSNAPNTLSGTNYVTCTFGAGFDGVKTWQIVKNDTTVLTAPSVGACGVFPYGPYCYISGSFAFNDTGQSTNAYVAPARNTTADASVAGLLTEGCAGQQALSSGSPSTATVSNACITGSTNVVECTDCSGSGAPAGAIRCVPSAGSLAITGPNINTDTICWARIQ